MTFDQLLDLVFVIHLDLVEERARTDRIISGIAAALGSEVPLVEPDELRAAYIDYLEAPIEQVDPEKLELMQVLGIA